MGSDLAQACEGRHRHTSRESGTDGGARHGQQSLLQRAESRRPPMSNELLQQLKAARDRAVAAAQQICYTAQNAGRTDLTEYEQRSFDDRLATVKELAARVAEAEEDERRAGTNNPTLARIRAAQTQDPRRPTVSTHVLSEPEPVYARHGRNSFASDLVRASTAGLDIGGEARRRLQEHAEFMGERYEMRDLSRVDGSGGYAVPPAWLVAMYVELARPGRAFADTCQRLPLPGGTDSINIPKVLTGTTVAVQTADNTGVSETNLTDTFINAPVRTIAGQQGVAIQLIDQSPIAFDEVIFSDLIRAHAGLLDTQVIYGSGSSGQILGVANTPGIQSVAVASLDIVGIFKAIANAQQLINTTRYLPAEVVICHPRRWAWLTSLLDLQNRPLVVPTAGGPFNAAAVIEDVDSQQIVGHVLGLPVITDPNLTTTEGAGSNEDQIYVMRSSDILLSESGLRSRVLPETRAANLTVLLQVFSYIAASAARYPQSVVQLTGLTPPSF
jgi:HK97 family phage major capsid protein